VELLSNGARCPCSARRAAERLDSLWATSPPPEGDFLGGVVVHLVDELVELLAGGHGRPLKLFNADGPGPIGVDTDDVRPCSTNLHAFGPIKLPGHVGQQVDALAIGTVQPDAEMSAPLVPESEPSETRTQFEQRGGLLPSARERLLSRLRLCRRLGNADGPPPIGVDVDHVIACRTQAERLTAIELPSGVSEQIDSIPLRVEQPNTEVPPAVVLERYHGQPSLQRK
jgi:hypothetical protein